MARQLSLLATLILVSTTFAYDQCPEKSAILPCTCDGEGVNCMAAKSEQEIMRAFQIPYPENYIRGLWIQGTPITSILPGNFGKVGTQQLYVEMNPKLTTVDPRFLENSKPIIHTVSFYGNSLSDSFPFQALGECPLLMNINLGKNQISTIPKNAFQRNQMAKEIILARNKIKVIPENLFAGLQRLTRVDISENLITNLGPHAMTFNSMTNLLVFLNKNQISTVDKNAFYGTPPAALIISFNKLQSLPVEPFGLLAQEMSKRGGQMDVTGNPLTCSGCDYCWIMQNKNPLRYMLFGFQCINGKNLLTLSSQDINCIC